MILGVLVVAGAICVGGLAAIAWHYGRDVLRARPQEPKSRPYHVEAAVFDGGAAEIKLAGELTRPSGPGPFPGLVLITGSGPHDRNEVVEGHKWFLVLSDRLTRSGYAVLRFDDRGIAESSGDFQTATSADFADDAAAALRWLRAQPEIDPERVGFLGHSEGGYIAPLAAQQVEAAFLVFMAGPAKRLLPDVMVDQARDILRAEGQSEALLERASRQVTENTAILRAAPDAATAEQRMKAYLKSEGYNRGEINASLGLWARPWGLWYAHHDPAPAFRAFEGPVLALFGGSDLQVSAAANAPVMEELLRHPRSSVQVLPGLNHLFQPSESGRIQEYKTIDVTIDEAALRALVTWLDGVTGDH